MDGYSGIFWVLMPILLNLSFDEQSFQGCHILPQSHICVTAKSN